MKIKKNITIFLIQLLFTKILNLWMKILKYLINSILIFSKFRSRKHD